jgi:hypothetical protein
MAISIRRFDRKQRCTNRHTHNPNDLSKHTQRSVSVHAFSYVFSLIRLSLFPENTAKQGGMRISVPWVLTPNISLRTVPAHTQALNVFAPPGMVEHAFQRKEQHFLLRVCIYASDKAAHR